MQKHYAEVVHYSLTIFNFSPVIHEFTGDLGHLGLYNLKIRDGSNTATDKHLADLA